MKKLLLALFLVVLAGCGNNSAAEEEKTQEEVVGSISDLATLTTVAGASAQPYEDKYGEVQETSDGQYISFKCNDTSACGIFLTNSDPREGADLPDYQESVGYGTLTLSDYTQKDVYSISQFDKETSSFFFIYLDAKTKEEVSRSGSYIEQDGQSQEDFVAKKIEQIDAYKL